MAKVIARAVHQDNRIAVRFAARSMSIEVPLSRLRPDVVLLDDVGDPAALNARVRETSELQPHAIRVLLASHMDCGRVRSALAKSVHAVVARNVEPASIAPVLRELARGHLALRPTLEELPAPVDSPLTDRELEILRLAAEGHTNAWIGRQLWVTEQTVKFHLSNVYRKLGVNNRTEATRYLYTTQLLAAPPAQLAS